MKKIKDCIVYIMLVGGFSIVAGSLKAQVQIGIEVGLSENILVTDLSNRPALSYHIRTGITASIPIKYQLNNLMSLRISPSYIQKNARLRNDSIQNFYENRRNTYIQIPFTSLFTFKYKLIKVSFELGVFEAYWLMGNVKGKVANFLNTSPYKYSQKYEFNSVRDRRWESGWLIGSEVNFHLLKKYAVFIHYSFCQSLTDQQKKYMIGQVPRYNRTHMLTFGYPISYLF